MLCAAVVLHSTIHVLATISNCRVTSTEPPVMERIVTAIFVYFVGQVISPETIKVHLYRFLLEIEKYVAEMNGDIDVMGFIGL